MTDSKKYMVRMMLLIVVATILTLWWVSLVLSKRDTVIYPSNISVGGVSLAGLTNNEAADLLTERLPTSYGRQLILQLPSRQLYIPLHEVDITYDVPATLAQIDAFLQQKGIGVFQHSIIRGKGINFTPKMNWDRNLIEEKLIELKNNYDQPAVDARIICSNDCLEYIEHRNGYIIDIAASLDEIASSLQKGSLGPITLVTKELYPRIKLEDIKEVKDMLGISMSRTSLPEADIEPIVKVLNGYIIMPGEYFSLTQVIRNKQIKSSNSALKFVDDNLYQAISQTGLKLPENRLGFINNFQHPIFITAIIDGNNLIIKIFGHQAEKGKEILLVIEKKEIPPQMQIKVENKLSPQQRIVVQEGQNGYIKRSYRVVKINGKEAEKTLLIEEYISGQDTIIAVGPGTIRK